MNQLFPIAAGGAFGAMARYLVSTAVYAWLGRCFPWGTLVVNILGSGVMGLLFVLFMDRMISEQSTKPSTSPSPKSTEYTPSQRP